MHLDLYLVSSLSDQIFKHVKCLNFFYTRKIVDQRSSAKIEFCILYLLFTYDCYLFLFKIKQQQTKLLPVKALKGSILAPLVLCLLIVDILQSWQINL